MQSSVSNELNLHQQIQRTIIKLKEDPSSITTEDARRLSENYDAQDARSARIISAVEALAVANVEVHEQNPSLGQAPYTSLLTLINDLHAAVKTQPYNVTDEVLKTTQIIVAEMQKAVGRANAPYPELEVEFQEELTRIEAKIEHGTVTTAEADHLHSLEARAHGHTEKGGITAIAQSVAAKRECHIAQNAGSNTEHPQAEAGSRPAPILVIREKTPREMRSVPQKRSLPVLSNRSNVLSQGSKITTAKEGAVKINVDISPEHEVGSDA